MGLNPYIYTYINLKVYEKGRCEQNKTYAILKVCKIFFSYRSCNNTSIVEANSNIWICNIFFVPHTVFNIAHKIISVWQITSLLNIYFQFTMEKMAFKGHEGSKMSNSLFTNFLIIFFLNSNSNYSLHQSPPTFSQIVCSIIVFFIQTAALKFRQNVTGLKFNVEKACFDGSLKTM